MRAFVISISFLCAGGLFGQTVSAIRKPIADRPVQPIAIHKDQSLPIVAFEKDRPVILLEGERKVVARDAISIRGVWDRTPGMVTVSLRGEFAEANETLGPLVGKAKALEAEIVSDCDLSDAFALVLVYETLGVLMLGDTDVQIRGVAIGELAAGQPHRLQIDFPKLRRRDNRMPFGSIRPTPRWGLLLFSRGKQIATSLKTAASDSVLEMADGRLFDLTIRERLKSTHSLTVFRSRPLRYSERINQRYAGQALQAKVSVTAMGIVEKVEFPDVSDDELRDSTEHQLRDWLFLPPCANGAVSASTALIPVKF